MHSTTIKEALAPFKNVWRNVGFANLVHQAIELDPNAVRCRTSRIAMETTDFSLEIENQKQPIHVDGSIFLSVLNSLPEANVTFSIIDNALHWKCGRAKGKLAMLSWPKFKPLQLDKKYHYSPQPDFLKALKQGAFASQMATTVVIDTRFNCVMSTDAMSTTASAAYFESGIASEDEFITLSPEAIALMSDVMTSAGFVEFTERAVVYSDGIIHFVIPRLAPLSNVNRLASLTDRAFHTDKTFYLTPDGIHSFLKRAEALSTNRPNTLVTITVQADRASFSFLDGASGSEDYFDINPQLPISEPIVFRGIPARKIMRGLPLVDCMAIDLADDRLLVMKNGADRSDFLYIIAGSR